MKNYIIQELFIWPHGYHFYTELGSQHFHFMLQKLFVVPSTAEQKKIPYARVNHNKYMVTDTVAYIGKLSTDLFCNLKSLIDKVSAIGVKVQFELKWELPLTQCSPVEHRLYKLMGNLPMVCIVV